MSGNFTVKVEPLPGALSTPRRATGGEMIRWVNMAAGDAMCICPGLGHNVPAMSPDYSVLEMCVPADYDTNDLDG